MKKLFFAMLVFSSLNIYSQVTEYKAGVSIDNGGVTYFLPQTELEVRVNVVKETYYPGEYSEYSKRELGIDNKGSEKFEKWVIKSCSVVPVGKPDPQKAYFIKYKPKNTAPYVTLTKDGIIRGINVQLPEMKDDRFVEEKVKVEFPKTSNYMTEEMLLAGSKAKKANLMAREIFNIRDSRNLLIRGEAESMPGDNESLKMVLDKLNEQEQALLFPFVGMTVKEEKQFIIKVVPGKDIDNKVLFRFSSKFGVVESNDLSGEPVYFSLKNISPITPEEMMGVDGKKGKSKKDKDAAVIYNVPGKAQIELSMEGGTLFEGTVPVAQYGTTESLGDVLFVKDSTISIEFDPTTGGLLHINH